MAGQMDFGSHLQHHSRSFKSFEKSPQDCIWRPKDLAIFHRHQSYLELYRTQ